MFLRIAGVRKAVGLRGVLAACLFTAIALGSAGCTVKDPLEPTPEEIEARRTQIEHGRQQREYDDIKRQKRKDAEYQNSVEGEAPVGLR